MAGRNGEEVDAEVSGQVLEKGVAGDSASYEADGGGEREMWADGGSHRTVEVESWDGIAGCLGGGAGAGAVCAANVATHVEE